LKQKSEKCVAKIRSDPKKVLELLDSPFRSSDVNKYFYRPRIFKVFQNLRKDLKSEKWFALKQNDLQPASKEYEQKVVFRDAENVETGLHRR